MMGMDSLVDAVSATIANLTAPLLLLSLVFVVLWTFLPFAVFGIKGRLDRSLELQEEIVRQLARQRRAFATSGIEPGDR